jgi:ferredoxin
MTSDVYIRLRDHLDKMPVAYPKTESGVELRILERLFTVEEAEVTLCLSALPEPLERIYRRANPLGFPREKVEKLLDGLLSKGVIHGTQIDNEPHYSKSIFVVGMYEHQLKNLTKEFQQEFLQYIDEGFAEALHTKKTTQLRTIPINVNILPERKVGTYDSARDLILESEGPFAVMDCICRKGMDLLEKPCSQTKIRETCLTFGDVAQTFVKREMARFVSQEEMLSLLEQADEEGMVVQPQNSRNPAFICCCCGCCCGVLTSAKRFPRPAEYFSTNYYVEVDPDLCQECGTCATRCQMEALQVEGTATKVDLDRCIGCGLCVSTCPSGAITLREKETETIPPKDMGDLYKRIMVERFGAWGVAKVVGKKLLGMKV